MTTALVCLLAACSSGETEPSSEGDKPTSGPAREAWRLDLDILGQPVDIDGVAVVYSHVGSKLVINAVNPKTGNLLWSDEATTSEVVPGMNISLSVVGPEGNESVAYFRPSSEGNLFADLIVADPLTGKVKHAVDGLLFNSYPDSCDDGRDVCVAARDSYEGQTTERRLRLENGRLVREPGAPNGSRAIGEAGLTDLGNRNPEYIARVVNGKVVWKFDVDTAFPDGSSSNVGWNFDLLDRPSGGQMYVGTLGGPAEFEPGDSLSLRKYNLTQQGSAAFDADTGEILWRDRGSDVGCGYQIEVSDVRCRSTGTASGPTDSLKWQDAQTTLEGFDLETGATTWSVALGKTTQLHIGDKTPLVRGVSNEYVFKKNNEFVVVNFGTGKARTPGADELFVCSEDTEFAFHSPYYVSEKAVYDRHGGDVFTTCDAAGQPTEARMTGGLAREFGVDFEGTRVLSLSGALVGYSA